LPWGQPGINLGFAWGQPGVNLHRPTSMYIFGSVAKMLLFSNEELDPPFA